jgi:hypothetical protein
MIGMSCGANHGGTRYAKAVEESIGMVCVC